MNLVDPSPLKPGDLDGLLRMFFRRQMPQPWPAPPTPHSRAMPARRSASSRQPLIRSRWALAASVGLLLLGSLLLPGRLTQGTRLGDNLDGPTIGDTTERGQMKREHDFKEFQEKHQPMPRVEDDLDESDMSIK
jgi:hypothetical protein